MAFVSEIILLLEPWIVFLLPEFCLGEKDLRLFLFLGVLVMVLLKNVFVINLIPSSIDIVVSSSVIFCIVETHVFYYRGSQVLKCHNSLKSLYISLIYLISIYSRATTFAYMVFYYYLFGGYV